MDRNELKRTLHEQFIPMREAVQKKLEYLQSDDVFTDSPYSIEDDDVNMEDDDLMNAFGGSGSTQPPAAPRQQPPAAGYQATQQAAAQGAPEASSPAQNMAARIAALRGISMPGDYLRRKN